jgi:hypothetical protein
MAKRGRRARAGNGQGETNAGYFRQLFEQNPDYLRERSNVELLQRWLDDHPGVTVVPPNVKTGLTNAKSVMRKKLRIRARRRRRGRPKAEMGAGAVAAHPVERRPGVGRLEVLEEHIDDCLSMAKSMDRDELASVIKLLHRARNEVVWKQGE